MFQNEYRQVNKNSKHIADFSLKAKDSTSKTHFFSNSIAKLQMEMFDLGGLASNNNFQEKDEILLLEEYLEKNISDQQILKYNAMKTASLLRETMWSMVSEITSKIDFDYSEYTEQNLDKFESSFNSLKS